jgi:hypothetical protein
MKPKLQAIEFKVGDPVTYKPYERAFKASVKEIRAHKSSIGLDDDRVFYILTGRDGDRVQSESTGLCIAESKYFREFDCNGNLLK